MTTPWHDRWRLWLTAGLALALGLVGAAASAQPICNPSTTPCQTCPAPPPCSAPTNATCLGALTIGNTTFTNSTVHCAGSFAQTTVITDYTMGPALICYGPEKSMGCLVPSGYDSFNTNTDTIGVAIPTLSVWALCALAVALGALALRRLRGPRPAQG